MGEKNRKKITVGMVLDINPEITKKHIEDYRNVQSWSERPDKPTFSVSQYDNWAKVARVIDFINRS